MSVSRLLHSRNKRLEDWVAIVIDSRNGDDHQQKLWIFRIYHPVGRPIVALLWPMLLACGI